MIRKKICMLGAYAVGKTSLVRRFVEDTFSDRYRTTIGVKITKKEVDLEGRAVTLLLWDLHGDDEFQTVRTSYLRGASGLFLVVDGTRADTIERARRLYDRAHGVLGDVPCFTIENKCDLPGEWELEEDAPRPSWQGTVLRTSAKTGEGVEEAFRTLARRMVDPE